MYTGKCPSCKIILDDDDITARTANKDSTYYTIWRCGKCDVILGVT